MRPLCLVALSLLLVACGHTRYHTGQRVAGAGGPRVWLAGSEGLATYYDGSQWHRHDYPLEGEEYAYAYGSSENPVAHVLMHRGTPFLFARPGELFTYADSEWKREQVEFPGYRIDRVIRRPDGGLLIQISNTLLWTTFSDVRVGRWEATETPDYFYWLGYVDGELYGLGADETRTLTVVKQVRRQWRILARLPAQHVFGEPRAVVAWPNGVVAAVGVWQIALLPKTGKQIPPQSPALPAAPPPGHPPFTHRSSATIPTSELSEPSSPTPTLLPAAPTSGQPEVVSTRSVLRWAGAVQATANVKEENVVVQRVVQVERGGSLLIVTTGGYGGIVRIESDRMSYVSCSDASRVVGGIVTGRGAVMLIGHFGGIWELTDTDCVRKSDRVIPNPYRADLATFRTGASSSSRSLEASTWPDGWARPAGSTAHARSRA